MNEIDAAERDRESMERAQEHERKMKEQERQVSALKELQQRQTNSTQPVGTKMVLNMSSSQVQEVKKP